MPTPLTFILPYYNQPLMLAYQLAVLNEYPPALHVILVDDGSAIPAAPLVREHASLALLEHLRVYRILVDKPWNREEARNLGAQEAGTPWIVQCDLDHVLPAEYATALLAYAPDPTRYYTFPRWRRGAADETRRKDLLAPTCTYGQILPHMDSYLVTKEAYWQAGGYDEVFSGVLGGGSEFLRRLTAVVPWDVLPEAVARLEVITKSIVADASDTACSRDTSPGKALERAKQASGQSKPTAWLLLPWERAL